MACFRHLLTPFHASVRKSMKNFEGYKDLLMKKSQGFKSDWETLGKKVEHAKLTSAVAAACTLLEKKFKEGKSVSAKQQLVRPPAAERRRRQPRDGGSISIPRRESTPQRMRRCSWALAVRECMSAPTCWSLPAWVALRQPDALALIREEPCVASRL